MVSGIFIRWYLHGVQQKSELCSEDVIELNTLYGSYDKAIESYEVYKQKCDEDIAKYEEMDFD